jgi:glycosyltransferase involved in cell wall biosynthesis
MIRLGIAIQETWDFFDEIYSDLKTHYPTMLFERRSWQLPIFHTRINRYIFSHDMRTFLRANDVVFFEWASELLAAATRMPKTCRIVTRLHRYELYEWAEKVNWCAVDKIILVSKAKQREFAVRFPDQASKIVVSFPSISLNKFTLRPKTFSGDIGTLCHLTPRKRIYELILAFHELSQKVSGFRLHIAGGSEPAYQDYLIALQYLVRELDLEDKVIFYGNVPDSWDWYHKIDIFISNSYSEGMQVAPMEAMASGCYCLSHHWDGANELLPEDQLYYTTSELVEKITNYSQLSELEKQNRRSSMHSMACEKFDIEITKRQIRDIIGEVSGN